MSNDDQKFADVIEFPSRPNGLGATVFQQALSTAIRKPLTLGVKPPTTITSTNPKAPPISIGFGVKPPAPTAPVSKAPISTTAAGVTNTPTPKPLPFHVGFTVAPPGAPKPPATKLPFDPKFNTPVTTGATQGGVSKPKTFRRGDKDPVINGLQQHLIAWGFARAK